MRAVMALLGKEYRLFFGDKASILLTFLVPFVLIYIFGNIFSGVGDDDGGIGAKITVAALNASGEAGGDAVIEAMAAEDSLRVLRGLEDEEGNLAPFTPESIRQGIVDRRYNFAVVVPEDYLAEDGIGVLIEFISNPRNQIESQVVNGLVQKSVFMKLPQLLAPQADAWQEDNMGLSQTVVFREGLAALLNESIDDPAFHVDPDDMTFGALLDGLMDDGSSAATGPDPTDGETSAGAGTEASSTGLDSIFNNLLTIREDQVYGKEVSNPHLTRMIGGYALMFLLFATTASAASLFEERREGMFLRLLSMPVKRTHILWSKYLFNTSLGVLQALTLFIASSFLFDIDVWSHVPTLVLICVLAASACTAFGMVLAAVCSTPQQTQGIGTLLILGMTAMSGAWVPLQWMPPLMQAIGKFSLVYWGIEAFRGALWEGLGVLQLAWPWLAVLTAYSVVLLAIAAWRFRVGGMFR
ncbi:ABC transporter permease [Marinihelvus fidelis]|uniref:ABC transporter permease n=1 Tax=Marinihelvus fidelis TaxID=2613842 RepID=A0A5N0T6X1_9GAMM|nr:ABC transporter permease [Marinihelvus fidelis]KAA9130541.1 ABC transporter permease [Marinihelvus fidelis]